MQKVKKKSIGEQYKTEEARYIKVYNDIKRHFSDKRKKLNTLRDINGKLLVHNKDIQIETIH